MMTRMFKAIVVGCLIGVTFYLAREVTTLSKRVETIEDKLGGAEKINWRGKEVVERVRESVVRIIGGISEGSGFAVMKEGHILTNFHVIDGEPSPKVILPDNTFETAQVIMADKEADLAVIKIDRQLPLVPLADLDKLEPADALLAVGYPLGGTLSGEASISKGLYSGRRQLKETGVDYIQTDMTFVKGMSGGPMINMGGEAVGISTTGLYAGGLGFAVSADTIREKWEEMTASEDPLMLRTLRMRRLITRMELIFGFYTRHWPC